MAKSTNIQNLESMLNEAQIEKEINSILEELGTNDAPEAVESGEADEKEFSADKKDWFDKEENSDDVKEVIVEAEDAEEDDDSDDAEESEDDEEKDSKEDESEDDKKDSDDEDKEDEKSEDKEEDSLKEDEELSTNDAPQAVEAGEADEESFDASEDEVFEGEEEADDVASDKANSENQLKEDEELSTNDAPQAVESGEADEKEFSVGKEDWFDKEENADDVKEVIVEQILSMNSDMVTFVINKLNESELILLSNVLEEIQMLKEAEAPKTKHLTQEDRIKLLKKTKHKNEYSKLSNDLIKAKKDYLDKASIETEAKERAENAKKDIEKEKEKRDTRNRNIKALEQDNKNNLHWYNIYSRIKNKNAINKFNKENDKSQTKLNDLEIKSDENKQQELIKAERKQKITDSAQKLKNSKTQKIINHKLIKNFIDKSKKALKESCGFKSDNELIKFLEDCGFVYTDENFIKFCESYGISEDYVDENPELVDAQEAGFNDGEADETIVPAVTPETEEDVVSESFSSIFSILDSINEELSTNDAPQAVEAGEADEESFDASEDEVFEGEEEADDVKEVVTESEDKEEESDEDDSKEDKKSEDDEKDSDDEDKEEESDEDDDKETVTESEVISMLDEGLKSWLNDRKERKEARKAADAKVRYKQHVDRRDLATRTREALNAKKELPVKKLEAKVENKTNKIDARLDVQRKKAELAVKKQDLKGKKIDIKLAKKDSKIAKKELPGEKAKAKAIAARNKADAIKAVNNANQNRSQKYFEVDSNIVEALETYEFLYNLDEQVLNYLSDEAIIALDEMYSLVEDAQGQGETSEDKQFDVDATLASDAAAEIGTEENQEDIKDQEEDCDSCRNESYSSFEEAISLGAEYFAEEEHKNRLIEQVALSIANENGDRLFKEMVEATVLATRLQEAIIAKYNRTATARVQNLIEDMELSTNDAPQAVEAGEADEKAFDADEQDYFPGEENADDVASDKANSDNQLKEDEELGVNDAPEAISSANPDEKAFDADEQDYFPGEENADDVASDKANSDNQLKEDEELSTNDAPQAVEAGEADEESFDASEDEVFDDEDADDVGEVVVESFTDDMIMDFLTESEMFDATENNVRKIRNAINEGTIANFYNGELNEDMNNWYHEKKISALVKKIEKLKLKIANEKDPYKKDKLQAKYEKLVQRLDYHKNAYIPEKKSASVNESVRKPRIATTASEKNNK